MELKLVEMMGELVWLLGALEWAALEWRIKELITKVEPLVFCGCFGGFSGKRALILYRLFSDLRRGSLEFVI